MHFDKVKNKPVTLKWDELVFSDHYRIGTEIKSPEKRYVLY
jgi:hypothetical protein